MKYLVLATLAALAISAASFVSPASAQASRTWVSGSGSDANPCSRTAPCQTFAGAYAKTAISGEINCLDSAGFGTLTISKSISVVCNGVVAGVLAAGTTGFTINTASTDHVVLDGMDIEGFGTGTHGLNVVGSGAIFIRNSSIRHFTGNGVNVAGTAGARVMVDNVLIVNNAGGVNVQGAAGAANSASVTHSFIDGNASFGVQASGSVNSLAIGWDVISNSPTAISALSSAQVVSFGPSSIVTGAGVPTSTPAFK